ELQLLVFIEHTYLITVKHLHSTLSWMNLFYHDVTQDLHKLKPTSLVKGQVCVVYWTAIRSWCRAVVESIYMDSISCQARIVLKCTYCYLKASTQTEAVLLESESDSTSMELYLTVSNIKICVNDDLVAKRFAYYSRDSADSGGLDEGDRLPVMLSSSILTQTISTASNKLITQSQPPLGKHRNMTAHSSKQYNTLSAADCYSWPAVARGCNTVIVSHNADQPLSYLTPLLTHILLNSIFTSFTSSSGPIAVLLCPGWEKVQVVYDLLEECNVAHSLHPISMLLGVGKDEAKAVKIPKNCLLLVTTPFTLVRLLSCHSFLFLRLYHLVLDEADQLFTLAPDQVTAHHFQSTHSTITIHIFSDLNKCFLFVQITLMTLESSKISVLLGTLDFNPDVGQKTLIVANSVQEVEDVFKVIAVSNKSAFCLKTHEGLTHQFDFAIQQWRKDVGPGSHVILVTTNDCVKCLGIRDATCVVHYGFPTSPKLFGSRLFCMAENFRNLSEQTGKKQPDLRTILNARHVVGILRYLGRTNALLPPELLSFAQGIQEAREDQKMNSPLCSYVKSFGVCRDSSVCPDRHRFISQLDQSELPASGVIEVVPLYIKTASVFYGRIVKKEDRRFDIMSSEMASYYADKKPGAKELLEGGLYAVQEEEVITLKLVCAEFIDVGKEEEVRSHQILHLPEQFQSLPGQAVEIIICRVKPVDAENNWHPKVTRAISQKIRGLQHRGRAVLSLGNTVFVDPMVRVTQVPGMKTLINEYSIQSEIQNTGMGIGNPEHLDLLRVKKLAAQELPHFKPCEPLSPTSSSDQSLVHSPPSPEVHLVPGPDQKSQLNSQAENGQRNTHPANRKSAGQMDRLVFLLRSSVFLKLQVGLAKNGKKHITDIETH
uniref:RNA helicase n=1 Tax=Stegastes partitus TaxID=144197 RepID=A0A3B5A0V1_9TELE